MNEPLPKRSIPVAAPLIGEREIAYVTAAVRSGWVSSMGEYLDRFEREFARFIGVRHAVAVSNGTVALHLAMHALGIGPGDEVIVPDLTFAATGHAVLHAGATPVFVDSAPDSWCTDPRAIERAIGPRTKAIVPVHLYGHPADMDAISAIAESHKLAVIEDAAEAHGARVGDKVVGSIGRVGAFSFYGNKVLTTGEGGMLTTDDEQLAARIRLLKDHGMTKGRRYFHEELAFNYRMTNLQAAVGVAQVERADELIERKRRIYGWYRERLGSRADVALNPELPGYFNVYWMVCAVLDADRDRERLVADLRERGIDTRPFFVPLSQMPHLSSYRSVGAAGDDCPVARRLAQSGLNLPSGAGLAEDEVAFVADSVASSLDAGRR